MRNPSRKEINEVAERIPKGTIIGVFGGVMATSPELFGSMVRTLAEENGTELNATGAYIMEVLAELPDYMD